MSTDTNNGGMSSTENVGFKVVTMGRPEVDGRQPCNLRPLTLAKLHAWIDAKTIDSRLKEELKKSASSYPQQALLTWQRSYARHVAKAQNALQDKPATAPTTIVELGDEPNRKDHYEEESANTAPGGDEFDAGWENPGKDQG